MKDEPRRRKLSLKWCLAAACVLGVLLWIGRSNFAAFTNWQARRCIADRDIEEALDWLRRSESLAPDNAEAQFLMARAYRHLARFSDVNKYLQRARDLGMPIERIEREHWLTLAHAGQINQASVHLSELLTDPQGDEAEICEAFVIGNMKIQDIPAAEKLIAAWHGDFPDDPQPLFYWGP